MSKIILGTAQLGMSYGINNYSGRPDDNTAFEILNCARENQIRYLDTADVYGDAYRIISLYHTISKSPFKIYTKFKGLKQNCNLIEHIRNILMQLGVSQIEGLSFHAFEEYNKFSNWNLIADLKGKSIINSIGVSLYTNDEFKQAIEDKNVDYIQLPFNVFDNWTLRGSLLQKAKQAGKLIQIRSCFLQGLLFKSVQSLNEQFKIFSQPLLELQETSQTHQLSIQEIALRYALSFSEINQVLIGVDNVSQLNDNLLIAAKRALPPKIISKINQIKIEDKNLLYPYNWKI